MPISDIFYSQLVTGPPVIAPKEGAELFHYSLLAVASDAALGASITAE